MSVTIAPGQQVGGLVAETGTRERPRTGGGRRRVGVGTQRRVVLLFLFFVFPVYWMVNTSFQPNNGSAARRRLLPGTSRSATTRPCCSTRVARRSCPPRATRSSSRSSLFIALVFAFLAALAVTRFRFKSRRTFIVAILVIQMIPGEAMIVSVFRVINGWHLLKRSSA